MTLTFDPVTPQINWVPLLPRMDMWTRYEEGWSRCSQIIDWKGKGYKQTAFRWTDQPTDMCKAICPLFFKGGHNNLEFWLIGLKDCHNRCLRLMTTECYFYHSNWPTSIRQMRNCATLGLRLLKAGSILDYVLSHLEWEEETKL